MKCPPKFGQKTLGFIFMRKKHDYLALLKYMHMLEYGYFINYFRTNYGINHAQLSKLWLLYQEERAKVLNRQAYTRSNSEFRQKVVLDIENRRELLLILHFWLLILCCFLYFLCLFGIISFILLIITYITV